MYPDATTSAVQAGQLGLCVQGDSLIWKNFLISVLVLSAMGIAFCLFNLWVGLLKSISIHDFTVVAFQIVACSMGFAGYDELARRGHRQVRRIFFRCLMIALVVPLIVLGIEFLRKTWWNNLFFLSASPFWVLLVAPFPVALYLNRRQKKSTSQPTVTNAP